MASNPYINSRKYRELISKNRVKGLSGLQEWSKGRTFTCSKRLQFESAFPHQPQVYSGAPADSL